VKTSAVHWNTTEYTDNRVENFNGMENLEHRFSPRSVNGPGFAVASALRMYTEEEVSDILQVSLSQLRKWRMKEQAASSKDRPSRKSGAWCAIHKGAPGIYRRRLTAALNLRCFFIIIEACHPGALRPSRLGFAFVVRMRSPFA
jgi:hypothetical protein